MYDLFEASQVSEDSKSEIAGGTVYRARKYKDKQVIKLAVTDFGGKTIKLDISKKNGKESEDVLDSSSGSRGQNVDDEEADIYDDDDESTAASKKAGSSFVSRFFGGVPSNIKKTDTASVQASQMVPVLTNKTINIFSVASGWYVLCEIIFIYNQFT